MKVHNTNILNYLKYSKIIINYIDDYKHLVLNTLKNTVLTISSTLPTSPLTPGPTPKDPTGGTGLLLNDKDAIFAKVSTL